jgi:hypothetical protein
LPERFSGVAPSAAAPIDAGAALSCTDDVKITGPAPDCQNEGKK